MVVERDLSFDISTQEFTPIWWNHAAVAYATGPGRAAAVDPPPDSESYVTVRLSNVSQQDARISFTAHFVNHAPGQWTGQDWLLVRVEETDWQLPSEFESDGYTLVGTRWFGGQLSPDVVDTSIRYRFNAGTGQLESDDSAGGFVALPMSGSPLEPAEYVLVARLQREYLQAAIIPVLRVRVTETGSAAFAGYAGERRVSVNACPERLRIAALGATLCRNLELQASPLASRQ